MYCHSFHCPGRAAGAPMYIAALSSGDPAFITSEPTNTPHHRTTIDSSEPIGSRGTVAKGRYCNVGEDIADAATIRDKNDGERGGASRRCVGSGTASVTFEVIAMEGRRRCT
jgi:hypothetical protein